MIEHQVEKIRNARFVLSYLHEHVYLNVVMCQFSIVEKYK